MEQFIRVSSPTSDTVSLGMLTNSGFLLSCPVKRTKNFATLVVQHLPISTQIQSQQRIELV